MKEQDKNSAEITKLKTEVYDILEQQAKHQNAFNQLEAMKNERIKKINALKTPEPTTTTTTTTKLAKAVEQGVKSAKSPENTAD